MSLDWLSRLLWIVKAKVSFFVSVSSRSLFFNAIFQGTGLPNAIVKYLVIFLSSKRSIVNINQNGIAS